MTACHSDEQTEVACELNGMLTALAGITGAADQLEIAAVARPAESYRNDMIDGVLLPNVPLAVDASSLLLVQQASDVFLGV